tara:strand:- start:743 stop:1444 length:702 start_codon:yes stop_codon:yes gene_type:complete
MCWLDKTSIEQMLKLRDKYNISTFVETGVFKGVNIRLHSFYWEEVMSCDIMDEYITIAEEYTNDRNNVIIQKKSSPDFLRDFIEEYNKEGRSDIVFIFLDAHFYDPNLPPDEKWVVVNELKALKGFKNCVICMHDFDCSGLGHCCYDGQPLGFPLVLSGLKEVNPSFYLYVNTKEYCDIHNEKTIYEVPELIVNKEVLDNVRYTNSCDRLRYRGILYCTPTELDLEEFRLRRA